MDEGPCYDLGGSPAHPPFCLVCRMGTGRVAHSLDCFFFSKRLLPLCVRLVQARQVSGLPEPPQQPVSSVQAGSRAERGCAFARAAQPGRGFELLRLLWDKAPALGTRWARRPLFPLLALGPAEGKGQRAEGKSCSFWVWAPGLVRHESLSSANHQPT